MKIREQDYKYIALNKPIGYVCALKDNLSLTIMELIGEDIKGLHIVGRLDKDTTGIILLTNDGSFTHNKTHPKKHVIKKYIVTLEKPFDSSYVEAIKNGLEIDHGKLKLLPGTVKQIDTHKCELTINEGKFHQIKKMFAALDNKVVELHRECFGDWCIADLKLEEGNYKFINKNKTD